MQRLAKTPLTQTPVGVTRRIHTRAVALATAVAEVLGVVVVLMVLMVVAMHHTALMVVRGWAALAAVVAVAAELHWTVLLMLPPAITTAAVAVALAALAAMLVLVVTLAAVVAVAAVAHPSIIQELPQAFMMRSATPARPELIQLEKHQRRPIPHHMAAMVGMDVTKEQLAETGRSALMEPVALVALA